MSSFEEKLARAKNASKKFNDVTVAFDSDVSDRRAELEAAILEASKDVRLAADPAAALRSELEELLKSEQDSLTTFRFYRMRGDEWVECTARSPLRLDVPLDAQYGYNYHGACKLAALRSGFRIEDDNEVALTEQEWTDVWSVLSGGEVTQLADAIWELNEWGPAARVHDLKKGLAGAPAQEPN